MQRKQLNDACERSWIIYFVMLVIWEKKTGYNRSSLVQSCHLVIKQSMWAGKVKTIIWGKHKITLSPSRQHVVYAEVQDIIIRNYAKKKVSVYLQTVKGTCHYLLGGVALWYLTNSPLNYCFRHGFNMQNKTKFIKCCGYIHYDH